MNSKKAFRPLAALLVLILIIQLTACGKAADSDLSVLDLSDKSETFEDGSKAALGAVKVVNLYGSWSEMGRQYGKLMSEELKEVYDFVEEIRDSSEENAAKVETTVSTQKKQCPYTIRSFFEGAAETSGLTTEQLQMTNAVERIAGLPKCSAVAVWGDYAKDKLVMGRNYDYSEDFKRLGNDVVVTVYHPADGALATATVGYTGEIYAVNAINEKGMFIELNNGKPSVSAKSPNARITGTTLLFEMMFEADSFDYMDLFFNTAACSSSYIINVANSERARSYEWCTLGIEQGNDLPEGLLISTNHYINPAWAVDTPTDENSWLSLTRRNNLIKLCEDGKGAIGADEMMEIMSKTIIDEGGAKDELTVYQMVVIPESLSLWLKIEDASKWTEIDLGSFLLAKK